VLLLLLLLMLCHCRAFRWMTMVQTSADCKLQCKAGASLNWAEIELSRQGSRLTVRRRRRPWT
jgi:hypothetical protein